MPAPFDLGQAVLIDDAQRHVTLQDLVRVAVEQCLGTEDAT